MRIWTSIEYDYPQIKEGIYREIKKTLIHFEDGSGNIQTKLDKLEACRLMAASTDRSSIHGTIEAKIGDRVVRLIAIS